MRIKTISHQVEFTIWRYERDVAVGLELVQSDALMELYVLHLDELAACCPILQLKQDLVVEAELELRHTAQKTSHVNAPKDLRSEHISIS